MDGPTYDNLFPHRHLLGIAELSADEIGFLLDLSDSYIDVNRGTTTFNELIGVTRAMAAAASKVVILASSKKLTHKMPNLELGWEQISVLITDDGISNQDKLKIENQGVTVLIAAPSGE